MKTVQKLKIFSLLMAMPFVANALDCPPGNLFDVGVSTPTNPVSGLKQGSYAITNSLSYEIQSGIIHLELRKNPGAEPTYILNCQLIGEVVDTDTIDPFTFPWPSKLNHTVTCNNGSFKTRLDAVYPDFTAVVADGAIGVTETILHIEDATNLFLGMTANIQATGTINLKTHINELDLSGLVCLKKLNK